MAASMNSPITHRAHMLRSDVEEAAVQEHRGDHPPVLVRDQHVGGVRGVVDQRAEPDERVVGRIHREAAGDDASSRPARAMNMITLSATRTLVAVRPADPPRPPALQPRADLAARDDLGARAARVLLLDALRTAEAHGRRDHALVADGPAAVGARDAGLAVVVPVAVLDLEVVRHLASRSPAASRRPGSGTRCPWSGLYRRAAGWQTGRAATAAWRRRGSSRARRRPAASSR